MVIEREKVVEKTAYIDRTLRFVPHGDDARVQLVTHLHSHHHDKR